MLNNHVSDVVLVLAAAVLIYVACNDLRHYKIRNDSILVLAALFLVHALVSGRWESAHWNVVFALFMFIVMFIFYAYRLMGGGDVKLLSVAFLWVGIDCALPFALLLLLFTCIHAIATKLGLADSRRAKNAERNRIAFAPSIAAALVCVFMLGCLAPMS